MKIDLNSSLKEQFSLVMLYFVVDLEVYLNFKEKFSKVHRMKRDSRIIPLRFVELRLVNQDFKVAIVAVVVLVRQEAR